MGLVIGGPEHRQRFGGPVQVEQDVRLLSAREGEKAAIACLAGSGGSALEVLPGACQASRVDGLPSGQGRGVGQDRGELLPAPGAQGVAQVRLEVADVRLQLVGDGRRTETAVEEPDGLGLG